jgi:hypothetical protein
LFPLPSTLSVGRDYGEDELSLFGGQTKVLFSKLLSRRTPKSSHHSSSSEVLSPASSEGSEFKDHPSSPAESLPDVHPSLVEYLSLLPPNQQPNFSPAMSTSDEQSITSFPSMMYCAQSPTGVPTSMGSVYPEMMGLNDADASLYGDFQSQNTGLFAGETMGMTGSSAGSLLDLGIMMSADAGIDEHWKAFMRDSGLLDNGRPIVNLK